eukprot:14361215-Alexandrium_andersonii.AAC.1
MQVRCVVSRGAGAYLAFRTSLRTRSPGSVLLSPRHPQMRSQLRRAHSYQYVVHASIARWSAPS